MSRYISFEGIDVYNRIPAKLYLISVAPLLKKPHRLCMFIVEMRR